MLDRGYAIGESKIRDNFQKYTIMILCKRGTIMPPKVLSLTTPIIPTSPEIPEGGGWLSVKPQNRARKGQYAGAFSPVYASKEEAVSYGVSDRFLTNSQIFEVYRRTPDVRAAVDSIVRRVATFDWYVEPTVSPHDEKYEDAVRAADAVSGFLSAPNQNGYTWQEVMTSFLTDVLIYDSGVLEIVKDDEGRLTELVPLKGSTVHPVIDVHGRIIHYEQDTASDLGTIGTVGEPIIFAPDQILYLRVYSNSDSAEGNPIIEALVDDVITMMRSSQHIMLALDADEIPPGLLVLAGVAGSAAKEARADLENLRGQDHKIRVLTTPDPSGIGAHWVELRHTPKDLEMREIVNDVRKTIWRCFGVMPVEMGETGAMPRATALVQMDVASSHLVTPILELIQAKINRMVIPPMLGSDLASLISFKFDREARLTAEEGARRSEMHGKYVQMGMMTRNEVRTELGLMPIDGGDIPTVDTPNGPVPFEFFMEHPLIVPPTEPSPPSNDDSGDDPLGGEEEAVEEPGEDDLPPPSEESEAPLFKSTSCSHDDHSFCNRTTHDFPSEWQSPSIFDGYRTLPLSQLSQVLLRYYDLVSPLWDTATAECVSIINARSRDGVFQPQFTDSALDAIRSVIDRLSVEWSLITAQTYTDAARIGVKSAVSFSGQQPIRKAEDWASNYHDDAMRWLTAPDGPLVNIYLRSQKVIQSPTDNRSMLERATPVDPTKVDYIDADDIDDGLIDAADGAIVITAKEASKGIAAAWGANRWRINNWQGKLAYLANQAMVGEMSSAGTLAGVGPVEWYVEWVANLDRRTCTTCRSEGDKGFRPLSSLTIEPGGDTECGAHCRCVLVMWTKDEVTGGVAEQFGPLK